MMFDGYDADKQDIQQEHFVFTLSSGQQEWRKIDITEEEDPYRHMKGGICIDGAIYYGVLYRKIARFDVRTEKIEFIQGPDGPEDFNAISYLFEKERSLCTGQIHTGEVIIVSRPARLESSKLFCVYYCDMTREDIRRCEIDGIADYEFRRIHGIGKRTRQLLCFPGHIENIMFFQ
ncbi:predicted protein [Arabidopsis lyrata subsp. lyrata]|uniref:Predicted protein n=1 Tax=Arabidopsis lyrata subsp. lyrata TaxID=81972 RepID=D7M1I9_ARALL|nr:predicted protein [Arabidopsis lyrata subsp. lyrata]